MKVASSTPGVKGRLSSEASRGLETMDYNFQNASLQEVADWTRPLHREAPWEM